MRTILITGGTDGIGKGIAMNYLQKGERLIVVGSSAAKGEQFIQQAKQLDATDRAVFIQADLSLVKENLRLIEELTAKFTEIDKVVFCAVSLKYQEAPIDTKEGIEFNFALAYLSRYVLSYGLVKLLEKSGNPVILNVCAPGMKGDLNFDDLQMKQNFKSMQVMFNGSRLNDLLGVAFDNKNETKKVKYILYNPWAVSTSGVFEAYKSTVMKMLMKGVYKVIGKSVEEAAETIIQLLDSPPKQSLSAFRVEKEISLDMETFDQTNAQRLDLMTEKIVKEIDSKF